MFNDISKAIVLDEEKLHALPFCWRNNTIQAWFISEGVGKGYLGGNINNYWIGFYDKDAKFYAGKIVCQCSCLANIDINNYEIKKFYDYQYINSLFDLEIQERLLSRLNYLIDNKIIEIKK